jgi:hypothetical protein
VIQELELPGARAGNEFLYIVIRERTASRGYMDAAGSVPTLLDDRTFQVFRDSFSIDS